MMKTIIYLGRIQKEDPRYSTLLPDTNRKFSMQMEGLKRIVFIIFGSLSFVLGVVGIFLPILPTTPLLLLAAFFYMRSSPHLYRWMITHPLWGRYLQDYLTHRAIRRKSKIGALVFLWSALLLSMFLVQKLWLTLLLLVVGISVTIHIKMLRTLD